MRATEFIVEGLAEGSLNEYRDQLWTWVQSKFPRTQWPEYVQRDFLYAKAKGNKNQKDLEDFLDEIQRDFGRVRWQLEKLPITLDIFTPKTQRMIQSREGGSSNPFQVPKDAERHAQQSQMIQQKGVSEEPIIVAKLSNGYDLIEGWHRTIQHLKEFPQGYTAPAWVGYGATYTSESVEQGVAEGLNELTNTSLKVKQPKDFVNTNDRKQVTWKVMKFKSGKDTYLINFTMQHPPTFGKKSKSNWNAVNVAFGVKEPQDEYSFGDEINTDLTARNKNQFLIYSTVINAIRKFITEYNTEIDEIIMQGAGERQQAMYQRFFQSAGKYFPGWHYNGKHSLVRDVPRQTGKKVREQDVTEGNFDSFKFGKPITFTAYHSSDSEIKRILPTDEFYFSDDRYTWDGQYIYKLKITLKNPYVVLDQKADYEGHARDSLPKIKAAGYDGVIYTPHSVDYGFRQGVCFYPQQQISNIKLVNSDSGK